jgi:RNA polymerase sigma-70 factor (ECF subfamily)
MTLGDEFAQVLDAARSGADWAVAVLYRDVNPPLLRYLQARAPDVADDLAGEVWMAVATKLAGFEGDESGFRGWVFTIAARRVIDHRRRRARRRTDPVPNEVLATRQGAADITDDVSSQAAVRQLVAGLPPEQAEVVLLRVVGGFSAAEVAEMTGRSPGSVRVLQHRALQRLAQRFGQRAVTP